MKETTEAVSMVIPSEAGVETGIVMDIKIHTNRNEEITVDLPPIVKDTLE